MPGGPMFWDDGTGSKLLFREDYGGALAMDIKCCCDCCYYIPCCDDCCFFYGGDPDAATWDGSLWHTPEGSQSISMASWHHSPGDDLSTMTPTYQQVGVSVQRITKSNIKGLNCEDIEVAWSSCKWRVPISATGGSPITWNLQRQNVNPTYADFSYCPCDNYFAWEYLGGQSEFVYGLATDWVAKGLCLPGMDGNCSGTWVWENMKSAFPFSSGKVSSGYFSFGPAEKMPTGYECDGIEGWSNIIVNSTTGEALSSCDADFDPFPWLTGGTPAAQATRIGPAGAPMRKT